ncbi:Dps family protein [[Mycoplasma] collis]|uniref:Dps family protein n=1 Tax=[Mycoplasma] collis TaxID=2127 RepID=UPI00051AC8B3|nr:DNA starvation/stationary phase protection protein [[Mycoplasma] collis]
MFDLEIKKLHKLQATLQMAYHNITNIHWHIEGKRFFEIHKKTDELRSEIIEFIDMVAEKIIMLNGKALVNIKEIEKTSLIKENSELTFCEKSAKSVVEYLTTVLNLVTNVNDKDFSFSLRVQPLIDEIILSIDKWKWQFEKYSINF